MSKIPKITNSFYNGKIGRFLANPYATSTTAVLIATVSNVSKDAVNCAYYTIQSLNNEKIPEDKRKFVAALDLSNGIMNVALQLLMLLGINKALDSIFDNKLAKSPNFAIDDKTIKAKFEKLPAELKAKFADFKDFSENYIKHTNAKKGLAKIGFSVLVTNIAMQIVMKRILTPLIATPMASVFKKKFEEADAIKKSALENKPIVDKK